LVHLHQDDLAVAERLARESIAAFADGDAYGAAGGQLYLGMILEGGGRTAETAACFTRARQAFAEIGSQALTIEATAGLARCALAGGDLSTATAAPAWTASRGCSSPAWTSSPQPATPTAPDTSLRPPPTTWNWIGGGWGVDALVGYQTRGHHNLDLAVDADQVAAAGVNSVGWLL
jgi:hypothetical protein